MKGRIRTVKPEIAKHALLWQLGEQLGVPLAYYYILLWCWTDRRGRFPWQPSRLRSEIAPFYVGNFSDVLNAFANGGFVVKYRVGGQCYGWIPQFLRHQHINGKEEDSQLPPPPKNAPALAEEMQLFAETAGYETRADLTRDPVVLEGDVGVDAEHVSTFVYYALDGERVKIGFSRHPLMRITQMRTHLPTVRLVAVEPGGRDLEVARHGQFSTYRLDEGGSAGREWFALSGELAEHIAELVRIHGEPDQPKAMRDRALGTRDDRDNVASGTWSSSSSSRSSLLLDSEQQQKPLGREAETNGASSHGVTRRSSTALVRGGKLTPAKVLEAIGTVFAELSESTDKRLAVDDERALKAQMCFLYWVAKFKHFGAIATPERLRRIVARLKENDGDIGEILYALDGAFRDDWLMGRDPRSNGKKWDDVDTILRDRAQVERLARAMPAFVKGKPHPLIPKLEAALRGVDAGNGTDVSGIAADIDGGQQ